MLKFVAALILTVYSWDKEGHAAIGMTTMSAVKGEALANIKRLLKGKDIVDVAPWTESLLRKYQSLEPMFYQLQNQDPSNPNCNNFNSLDPCPGNTCLVQALKYHYSKLVHEPVNDIIYTPLLDLALNDVDNLLFVVALLAELHAPMRFGYTANNGGKNVTIHYIFDGAKTTSTLYNYWESDMIKKTLKERPNFWYSGWTHTNSLGRGFLEQNQNTWAKASHMERLALFDQWAGQTYETLCTRVQVEQFTNNQPIQNDHFYPPTTTLMDFEFLKTRILAAGIRTSVVINSVLNSATAQKLRHSPSFNLLTETIGNDEIQSSGSWTRNLGLNLVIIFLVLVNVHRCPIASQGMFSIFINLPTGYPSRQSLQLAAKIKSDN